MSINGYSEKQINPKEEFQKNYNPKNPLKPIYKDMNLKDLRDYCENNEKFLREFVEIGIEKGLCWVDDNKKVNFLMEVDDKVDDFSNFLQQKYEHNKIKISVSNDLMLKCVINFCTGIKYKKIENTINFIDKYKIFDYIVKNHLEAYKHKNEKVKIQFREFIAIFYYIYTKRGKNLEDYYFIAKYYLHKEEELRREFCTDYLKCCRELSSDIAHKLRRVFKYEDYSLEVDVLNKEKIKFILESGMGIIKKENNVYNVTYKSNEHKCTPKFLLECVREINQYPNIEEDDLKKYIL